MTIANTNPPLEHFSGVVKPEHVDALNQNKSAKLVISDSRKNSTTYNVSLDMNGGFVFKLDTFPFERSPKPEHSDAIEKFKFDILIHSDRYELMPQIVANNIADGTLISTIKDMSPFRAFSIVREYIYLKTTQEEDKYDLIDSAVLPGSVQVIKFYDPFESDDVYHPFESDDFQSLTKVRPDIALELISKLNVNFSKFDIEDELLKVLESNLTSAKCLTSAQEIKNFIGRVPSYLWKKLTDNSRFTAYIDELTGNNNPQLTDLILLSEIKKHCPSACESTSKVSRLSAIDLDLDLGSAAMSKKYLSELKDISNWELLIQDHDFMSMIQRVMPQGAEIDKDSEAIMVNILKVSPKIFAELFPHLTDHSSGRLLFKFFSQALSADDISEEQFEQLINAFNQSQANFLKEFAHLYEWLLIELDNSNPKRAVDIYLGARNITPPVSSYFAHLRLVKSSDAMHPSKISQEKRDALQLLVESNKHLVLPILQQ